MTENGAQAAPGRGRRSAPLRHRAGWLLLAAVVLIHVLGANELLLDRFGWGDAATSLRRIEVAFVRELAQAAPPQPAPAPPRPRRRAALPSVASAPAASAPMQIAQATPTEAAAAREPAPAPALPAAPTLPEPEAASSPPGEPPPAVADALSQVVAAPPPASAAPAAARAVAASAPVAVGAASVPLAAPAPAPQASEPRPVPVTPSEPVRDFSWPPSTRLTYQMEGYYRGPILGSAQVEWLRSGNRYQVHLETAVVPVLSRRISSEGELTELGLAPRRFEGEQRVLLRSPRRWSLQFGAKTITLADGREVARVPGVQDEASQFVQLTWLFTTQPSLLRVGRSIEVPLVLNRRLDHWIYDVKEVQQLNLPFGSVQTYYVKPRRIARHGDMTAEIWFAPSLQYLPVRILIRQDESTFVDLKLDRAPLQAER